jgi:hypothetical protein
MTNRPFFNNQQPCTRTKFKKECKENITVKNAELRNRNDLLRFRSYLRKVLVPVPTPVQYRI